MIITYFLPVLVAVAALALMTRRKLASLFGVFILTLAFGAAAVVVAPMLGGASILLAHLALVMVLVAAMAVIPLDELISAARSHAAGLLLAVYALIIAYFGPRLFASGDILVVPMRDSTIEAPLQPQASNITHTAYLIGSILLAWATTALMRTRVSFGDLRNAVLLTGALHAAFGAIDFIASLGGVRSLLGFLRNAGYNMLDQTAQGVPRAAGAFPEPSAYATLSAALMIFCTELWLQKRDRLAGLAGLALAGSIVLSMSSAGFFVMALYGAILVLRLGSSYRTPGMFTRLLSFLVASASLVVALIFVVLLAPGGLGNFGDVFTLMTVEKLGSSSAAERTGWALQGLRLFAESFGFGVGAGSFRSSSFVTAVVGSLGVIGVLLLGTYVLQLCAAIGRRGSASADYRVSAWAALGALAPQLVIGVTPDPGLVFGVFLGAALAQRQPVRVPAFTHARVAG